MYVLLCAVLGCIGVTAAQIVLTSSPAVFVPYDRQANACALRFPGWDGGSAAQLQGFNQCMSGAGRFQGLFALGGGAVVLALVAALGLTVPWLEWWRVTRGPLPDIPAAAAKFGELCGEPRAARRRPRLMVAAPGVGQAFTAALPGRHPVIVIPAAVAVAHADPAVFDPVVQHEIAHVGMRDVTWVSGVRWISWVTVPLIAAVTLLGFGAGTMTRLDAWGYVLQGCLSAVAAVLIGAALLRHREMVADRVAAAWLGSPDGLRSMLATGRQPRDARGGMGRIMGWPLRALARHPPAADRIRALGDAAAARDGGFVYALITGTVTAMVMSTSYYVAAHLDVVASGWLPGRVSAAAGGILIGCGLTPVLLRRAKLSRDGDAAGGWWQLMTGVAAGVMLGLLICGADPAPSPLLVPGQLPTLHAMVTALLTVGAATGAACLSAGLASYAASQPRGAAHLWWVPACVAVASSCCAAAALWPVPIVTVTGIPRIWLTFALPADHWLWLPLAYPAAVLLLRTPALLSRLRAARTPAFAGQPALGRDRLLALARAAAPGLFLVCVAAVAAAIILPGGFPGRGASTAVAVDAFNERCWAAAAAGWAVLLVLAFTGGTTGLARACAAGWLVTLATGLGLFTYRGLTGHAHTLDALVSGIRTSSVWLFYLAVATSLVVVLAGRRPAPTALTRALPATAVAVAVLITPLSGTWIAPLSAVTTLTTPKRSPGTAPGSPARPRHAAPRSHLVYAGRKLTSLSAARVIRAMGTALPPGWSPVSAAPARGSGGHVTITPAACNPLQAFQSDQFPGMPRLAAQAQGEYQARNGLYFAIGSETLTIQVRSYSQPIPLTLLKTASRDVHACPRETIIVQSHRITEIGHLVTPPHFGVPSWRADFTFSYRAIYSSTATIMIVIGQNLIILRPQAVTPGSVPQLNEPVIRKALTAAMNTLQSPHD